MRHKTLSALIVSLAVSAQSATNTWHGVNTDQLYTHLGDGVHDLSPYADADVATTNGYDVWSLGTVPGPGDQANINWSAENDKTAVWSQTDYPLQIDGAFNPDHIRYWATAWNQPLRNYNAQIELHKDLSIESIYIGFGYSSSAQGEDVFHVEDGYTLTLTGTHPVEFDNQRGGWWSIGLGTGSALVFAGADQTFDSFNYWSRLGGDDGIVEFAATNATITLAHPGVRSQPHIMLGKQKLYIRSDQTWTSPQNTGQIAVNSYENGQMVYSLDGPPLNNLTNVAFYIDKSTVGNYSYYIPEGSYQGIYIYGTLGYTRTYNYRLSGDVLLAGGAVSRGDNASVETVETDYSLILHGNADWQHNFYTEGYDLTMARGLWLLSTSVGNTGDDEARMDIDGSTVDIGGDLLYEGVYTAGRTNTGGAYTETRNIGLSGDADTVVTLRGNFYSDLRSRTGSNLYLSTLKLVGGSEGDPNTYEVGCDGVPGNDGDVDDFTTSTYAIGKLHIGDGSTAGFVMLVNSNLNDGDNGMTTNSPFKNMNDEILMAGEMHIEAGSILDLNGQHVLLDAPGVSNALSIATDAWLDLNTGMALSDNQVLTNVFKGLGHQVPAWEALQQQVRDSSQPNFAFRPVSTKLESTPAGAVPWLEFDGVNDHVNLPDDGLGAAPAAFTVELWMKGDVGPAANGGWGYALHRGSDQNVGSSIYWLGIHSSGNYGGAANGNHALGDSGIAVEPNAWHHLALSYDGTNQTLYVDATAPLGAANIGSIGNSGTGIGIGSTPNNSTYRPIDGLIAEVRVWDHARTQTQIADNMNQQMTGAEAGLVAYWPLDDGSGTTAVDAAGSNDGTLVSGPTWDTGNTYWQAYLPTPRGLLIICK